MTVLVKSSLPWGREWLFERSELQPRERVIVLLIRSTHHSLIHNDIVFSLLTFHLKLLLMVSV